MSFPKQGSPNTQTKFNIPIKGTTLNPNAAEFVPFSLQASPGTSNIVDVAEKLPASASSSERVLDRSESSISVNSDEEARQYWRQQLPDDITPDFNVVGENGHHGFGSLSLAGLSLHRGSETNRLSTVLGGGYKLNEALDLSTHQTNGGSFGDNIGFPVSVYVDDPSPSSYLQRASKPWEMQLSSDHLFGNGLEGYSFEEITRRRNPNDMATETSIIERSDMHSVEFLASQFPGFAAESLAEAYFANGCDLNLTIEMLTQLELQGDGAKNQNMNPKTISAPNLTSMDFPVLPVPDAKISMQKYTEDELQQTINSYVPSVKDNLLLFKSNSSISAKGATDFASAVCKLSSQDACLWKYGRSGSADVSVGSSSSHALSASYNTGAGRCAYSDRIQGRSSARAAPVWRETRDAVANLYSEVRGEARDRAHIRNVYFEQARQAYLMGNKALAKDLSVKGQIHNMQMKAAHSKAQETIYCQRNPLRGEQLGGGRWREKKIDLHGLHVNEALHVLKQELNELRNTARLGEQRLHVYICVGTGHHTRGSRTPARLPIAVQGYLLEEGLQFSEPQPGLLRVVLY